MKRILNILFGTTILLTVFATIASAHAKLDHCAPGVGSTNNTAPSEVRCWFSEELDTKQSTLSVTDSNGQRVDNGDAKVDLNDKEHRQLFVTIKSLPQGIYKVSWHAVTTDDNAITEGTWYFGVGQVTVPTAPAVTPAQGATLAAPASTPQPGATLAAPASTPQPGATPAAPAATSSNGPDATRTYIVAGGILLVAAGIALITRRVIT